MNDVVNILNEFEGRLHLSREMTFEKIFDLFNQPQFEDKSQSGAINTKFMLHNLDTLSTTLEESMSKFRDFNAKNLGLIIMSIEKYVKSTTAFVGIQTRESLRDFFKMKMATEDGFGSNPEFMCELRSVCKTTCCLSDAIFTLERIKDSKYCNCGVKEWNHCIEHITDLVWDNTIALGKQWGNCNKCGGEYNYKSVCASPLKLLLPIVDRGFSNVASTPLRKDKRKERFYLPHESPTSSDESPISSDESPKKKKLKSTDEQNKSPESMEKKSEKRNELPKPMKKKFMETKKSLEKRKSTARRRLDFYNM
jgi:hypothetical protein